MFDLIASVEQGRVEELEAKIVQARDDYYNGQASVPDEVYDAWVDELAELKENSTAVTAIGAPPVSAWPKVEHTIPMGSQEKVQTLDEMTNWIQERGRKGRADHLLVTEKLDGISISLRYENGKFVQGVTRGDGLIGEDITPNVAKMKGVIHNLGEPISVTFRGEIVLFKEDHKLHFPDKANPRNTASGTAKRLDGKGCEHLTVMLYHALDGPEFTRAFEMIQFILKFGFLAPKHYLSGLVPGVKTPHDLWVDYQSYIRESLPYEIDGLVVCFDDLAYQWGLGEHNGRPKGSVAFKFAPITRETVAVERVDQVGGTGRITPVAVFKPIRILGAEISRASLYNQAYIEKIGWGVGAKILVSRANDVIPRVVSVTGVAPDGVSQPPATCPECGSETERDGEYIVCPNTAECPAQTEGRIKQWIRELGILEWGSVLIQKVVSEGLVKSVPDLYRLTQEQVAGLERMGESSAKNALTELWKVNPLPLESLLGALGIPLCATSTMQTVVDAGFDTMVKVRTASEGDLVNIPGMGPKRASALHGWLQRHGDMVDDLLATGITIKEKVQGPLTGSSVCFTGKSNLKRAELERLAKEAGASVKKSVGKGLSFLVLADPNSTSSKAKAARKNGTECISEEDFLERVGYAG